MLVRSGVLIACLACLAGCGGVRQSPGALPPLQRPESPRPPQLDAAKIPGALASAIAAATSEGRCSPVCLVVDDRVGTLGKYLRTLAVETRSNLRERGVPADVTPFATIQTYVTLVGARDEDLVRLTAWLDRGPSHRPRDERSRWPVPDEHGQRVFVARVSPPENVVDAEPLGVSGLEWVVGPDLPWSILELRSATPNGPESALDGTCRIVARCADATRVLDVRTREGSPVEVVLLAGDPDTTRGPSATLSVPTDRAPGTREIPLQARVWSPADADVYIALDRTGRLWYGSPLGLWGPPTPGYGGGLAVLGNGFVTARPSDGRSEAALVHVTLDASRNLVENARVPLGPFPVETLTMIDLGHDRSRDVVVAQRTASGSRLLFLVTRSRE